MSKPMPSGLTLLRNLYVIICHSRLAHWKVTTIWNTHIIQKDQNELRTAKQIS